MRLPRVREFQRVPPYPGGRRHAQSPGADPVGWIKISESANCLTGLLYGTVQKSLRAAHTIITMFDPSGAQPGPLTRFAKASLPRALWQLASSLLPFVAGWGLMA